MAVNLSLLNANTIENINTNFTRVQTSLQDAVSRSGTTPNFIGADLDLNSNDVLNVGRIDVQEFYMNGQPIVSIPGFEAIIEIAPDILIVAGIRDEVVAVAANSSNVNLVGGNIVNVNTVAAIAPGIQYVIDNEANLDLIIDGLPEITIVANNMANVNSVGVNIANVNIVAPSITNVNTIATNISSVNTASTNIAAIIAAPGAASAAAASEDRAYEWANNPEDVVVTGGEYSAYHWAKKAAASADFDPANYRFSIKNIGEYYFADTGEAGVAIPPSAIVADNTWVELTAGLTGVGQFNENKLSGESVSGSAPNVTATANVAVAGPMNGVNIVLLNTEKRFLRPGAGSDRGLKEASRNLQHNHTGNSPAHTHDVPLYQSAAAGTSGARVGSTNNATFVQNITTSSAGGGALTINNEGGADARPNSLGVRIFRKVG